MLRSFLRLDINARLYQVALSHIVWLVLGILMGTGHPAAALIVLALWGLAVLTVWFVIPFVRERFGKPTKGQIQA